MGQTEEKLGNKYHKILEVYENENNFIVPCRSTWWYCQTCKVGEACFNGGLVAIWTPWWLWSAQIYRRQKEGKFLSSHKIKVGSNCNTWIIYRFVGLMLKKICNKRKCAIWDLWLGRPIGHEWRIRREENQLLRKPSIFDWVRRAHHTLSDEFKSYIFHLKKYHGFAHVPAQQSPTESVVIFIPWIVIA